MDSNNLLKELKVEDYMILSVQNKELTALNTIISDRESFLRAEITSLKSKLDAALNEKEEHRVAAVHFKAKLSQYDLIKKQLVSDYQLMNAQIEKLTNNLLEHEEQIEVQKRQIKELKDELEAERKVSHEKDTTIDLQKDIYKRLQNQMTMIKMQLFEKTLNGQAKKTKK